MEIILGLCASFVFGLFFGKIAKRLKLPVVIGYLFAGILIGPNVLNLVDLTTIDNMELFTTIALSFVSFEIGAESKWSYIKRLGKKPFIIGIICSLFTMLTVTLVLLALGQSISFSLLLGAIASSTAPAAIMMVVHEYRAKGDFTDTILGVIGVDDILSIIMFGLVLVIAEDIELGINTSLGFFTPFVDIIISLVVGAILGLTLGFSSKLFKQKSNIICLILTHIFISILIGYYADMSSLLICTVMGTMFVNAYNRRYTDRVIDLLDYISSPMLMVFFVLSGASLAFEVIPNVGFIGIIYILTRIFGKILGAFIGCKIAREEKDITQNLGPALLSQTGLAIGLAVIARDALRVDGNMLMTIVIGSSFIFDLLGPFIIKRSLKKAGDIR